MDTLLDDPTLPEKVEALASLLEDEATRRLRFYDEIRDDQKAEFINGEVIMHSPAKERHLTVRDNLHELLRRFVQIHKLGIIRGEKALCAFPRNDYEPDVCFFGLEKTAKIDADTMKFPVPDFICEVLSDSTEKHDRGVKFQDYLAHGVAEYWLVDPLEKVVEQYVAKDGEFDLRMKSGSGEISSTVINGFKIPVTAIFDEAENLKVLRELLG
ncbi:MAG: Uma2 family endonuclease, partial [Verrucomicrobiota bacterium]